MITDNSMERPFLATFEDQKFSSFFRKLEDMLERFQIENGFQFVTINRNKGENKNLRYACINYSCIHRPKSSQSLNIGRVRYDMVLTIKPSFVYYKVANHFEMIYLPGEVAGEQDNCKYVYSLFRFQGEEDEGVEFYLHLVDVLSPIHDAASSLGLTYDRNQIEKMTTLARSNPGWSAGHVVASLGWRELLLSPIIQNHINDVDMETQLTPLRVAINTGSVSFVAFLFTVPGLDPCWVDSFGETVIHLAAKRNDPEMLEAVLSACSLHSSIDVNALNAAGNTALLLACRCESSRLVNLLLDHGANPSLGRGHLPLHSTIVTESLDCFKSLTSRFPNIVHQSQQCDNDYPIHLVTKQPYLDLLLELGANPDVQNQSGATALHLQVAANELNLVLALLYNRADPNVRDAEGSTALHYAVMYGASVSILRALLIFEADVGALDLANETTRHLLCATAPEYDHTDERDLALYTLHAVGAQRCPPDQSDCTVGCANPLNLTRLGLEPFDGQPPSFAQENQPHEPMGFLEELFHIINQNGGDGQQEDEEEDQKIDPDCSSPPPQPDESPTTTKQSENSIVEDDKGHFDSSAPSKPPISSDSTQPPSSTAVDSTQVSSSSTNSTTSSSSPLNSFWSLQRWFGRRGTATAAAASNNSNKVSATAPEPPSSTSTEVNTPSSDSGNSSSSSSYALPVTSQSSVKSTNSSSLDASPRPKSSHSAKTNVSFSPTPVSGQQTSTGLSTPMDVDSIERSVGDHQSSSNRSVKPTGDSGQLYPSSSSQPSSTTSNDKPHRHGRWRCMYSNMGCTIEYCHRVMDEKQQQSPSPTVTTAPLHSSLSTPSLPTSSNGKRPRDLSTGSTQSASSPNTFYIPDDEDEDDVVRDLGCQGRRSPMNLDFDPDRKPSTNDDSRCPPGGTRLPRVGGGDQWPHGPSGYRILAMDGGGVRGLILSQVLRAIEKAANKPVRELFDWIIGSSAGAMASLCLASGKCVQCCRSYLFHMKDLAFKGSRPYDNENLELVLKQGLGEHVMMTNLTTIRVAVATIVADRLPPQLHLFRNYMPPRECIQRLADRHKRRQSRNHSASSQAREDGSLNGNKPPPFRRPSGFSRQQSYRLPSSKRLSLASPLSPTPANQSGVDGSPQTESSSSTTSFINRLASPFSSPGLPSWTNWITTSASNENVSNQQQSQQPDFEPIEPDCQVPVWKAARASGAAPTYFRSCGRFLDGGILSNNPTLDLLTEVQEMQIARRLARKPPIPLSVVVSIGTGRSPVSRLESVDIYRPRGFSESYRFLSTAQTLVNLVIESTTMCDGPIVERASAWCASLGVSYFRFSPSLGYAIPLDCTNTEDLLYMLWETDAYLYKQRDRIARLANLLVTGSSTGTPSSTTTTPADRSKQ